MSVEKMVTTMVVSPTRKKSPANTAANFEYSDLNTETAPYLYQGSGYFFHGKMPGCCLPSLTAATALHFTAGY
jgi:hypothetical protein